MFLAPIRIKNRIHLLSGFRAVILLAIKSTSVVITGRRIHTFGYSQLRKTEFYSVLRPFRIIPFIGCTRRIFHFVKGALVANMFFFYYVDYTFCKVRLDYNRQHFTPTFLFCSKFDYFKKCFCFFTKKQYTNSKFLI